MAAKAEVANAIGQGGEAGARATVVVIMVLVILVVAAGRWTLIVAAGGGVGCAPRLEGAEGLFERHGSGGCYTRNED